MAKTVKKPRSSSAKPARPRAARKSLAELNAWLTTHYDDVMDGARKNCVRLTGKTAFGGGGRGRKSA